MSDEERPTPVIDTTVAHSARVWNYWLGGKDNYAVDRAAKVLRDAGLTSFYVQAGGDLYAAGKKPDGGEWSAGIRDPRGPEGVYFAILPLSDHAFSTAGDYERSYVISSKRYHHIIDPRTGKPATATFTLDHEGLDNQSTTMPSPAQ